MDLKLFEKDGLEILIDIESGESYASISAYSRLSGLTKQAISKRIQGVNPGQIKTAEIPTAGGLQGVNLINEDLISEWLPKDNPEMATKLLKFGVRGFLHQLAGYEITSTAVSQPKSQAEVLLMYAQQLVEVEQRQQQTETELSSVKADVKEIQDRATAAAAELRSLPLSDREVPCRTTRNNINARLRAYCHATGLKHGDVWGDLYREFRIRYHIDLKMRANNGKSAPLDIAENLDVIDDLYAIACELFKFEGE